MTRNYYAGAGSIKSHSSRPTARGVLYCKDLRCSVPVGATKHGATCSCSCIPPNGLTSKAIFSVVGLRKRCRLKSARVHRPCLFSSSPCRHSFIACQRGVPPPNPHPHAIDALQHKHPLLPSGGRGHRVLNSRVINPFSTTPELAPAVQKPDNGIWSHALSSPVTSWAS